MSALATARLALRKTLEAHFDDFKIIWAVFVPSYNIQHKTVNEFLDAITVMANHYFTLVKILMIYHQRFPLSGELVESMYGEATQKLKLQEVPMFNYSSMAERHTTEVQAVAEAFNSQERQRLADIRKAFGDVQLVSLDAFNQLLTRVVSLETQHQRDQARITALEEQVQLLLLHFK